MLLCLEEKTVEEIGEKMCIRDRICSACASRPEGFVVRGSFPGLRDGMGVTLRSMESCLLYTSLVEGEIGISGKGSAGEWRMYPGQLAACDHRSGEITFREVDVRKYTAWKNGEFCFNDDTLEEILEELGRWYDVKICLLYTSRCV